MRYQRNYVLLTGKGIMDRITNLHVVWWRLYIKLSARGYPVPMQTLLNPSTVVVSHRYRPGR